MSSSTNHVFNVSFRIGNPTFVLLNLSRRCNLPLFSNGRIFEKGKPSNIDFRHTFWRISCHSCALQEDVQSCWLEESIEPKDVSSIRDSGCFATFAFALDLLGYTVRFCRWIDRVKTSSRGHFSVRSAPKVHISCLLALVGHSDLCVHSCGSNGEGSNLFAVAPRSSTYVTTSWRGTEAKHDNIIL